MNRRGSSESDSAESPKASQAEVGRMVDSSQADDRRMIRLVRERPLLFARNNMPVASYYSQVKRLWQEVANIMGWTVADVRRKWSNIRNSYSRHLRNEMQGACTSKGRMVSKWYLADELQFLREHMATDTRLSHTSRSLTSYAPTFLETELAKAARADRDIKPFAHSPVSAFPPAPHPWSLKLPPAPAPAPAHDALSHTNSYNEDSCGSQTFEPDENSAYFQFFRGIYKDYLELTPKKQRLFRRQCLIFLHHLVDEDVGDSVDEQSDAINLSNPYSEDEKEQKVCVIENVESYNILPH